jgi:hypothetical protein
VIAGRSHTAKPVHLQRHLMARPYQDIEFYTIDDLPFTVVQLSKNLA